MTAEDGSRIIGIAVLAAMADGVRDSAELALISQSAERLGISGAADDVQGASSGALSLTQLAAKLGSDEARRAAYDVAVAVCNAKGTPNLAELDFLRALSVALSLDPTVANAAAAAVTAVTEFAASPSVFSPPPAMAATAVLPTADLPTAFTPTTGSAAATGAVAAGQPTIQSSDALATHILDQAMLTAALELLPDRLANLGILPLQMRLVHHIGAQFGQQTEGNQIKELIATFGLCAAAQVMESVVRKAFGGIAGGLIGGLFGGAAGLAAGGAVTFASTYALGHAAEQYYANGRSLSTADMKSLFSKFQSDANTMYPRVQDRIALLAQKRVCSRGCNRFGGRPCAPRCWDWRSCLAVADRPLTCFRRSVTQAPIASR